MVFNQKCHFSKIGYTLGGSQKERVAFLGNFLNCECRPIYPAYTTFDNFAKYCIEKKLGQFL